MLTWVIQQQCLPDDGGPCSPALLGSLSLLASPVVKEIWSTYLCVLNPASTLESPEAIKNTRMPGSRHFPLMSTQGWQARTAWALKLFPPPKSWDQMTTVRVYHRTRQLEQFESLSLSPEFSCLLFWVCAVFSLESLPSKLSTVWSREDEIWAEGNNRLEHRFLQVPNWRRRQLRSPETVPFQHPGIEEEGPARAAAQGWLLIPQVSLLTHWLSCTRCVSESQSLHGYPRFRAPLSWDLSVEHAERLDESISSTWASFTAPCVWVLCDVLSSGHLAL